MGPNTGRKPPPPQGVDPGSISGWAQGSTFNAISALLIYYGKYNRALFSLNVIRCNYITTSSKQDIATSGSEDKQKDILSPAKQAGAMY
eukprot:1144156-Pelagomonas_calceolata.AAC.1